MKRIFGFVLLFISAFPLKVFADTEFDFNAVGQSLENEPLAFLGRCFIILILAKAVFSFGGKLLGSARNMISNAVNGGGSSPSEKAMLREQKAQDRANKKARAKEEAYQRNQNYAAAEEFILECAENAVRAGQYVSEKVRAAGRWVKEKFTRKGRELKAGADMAIASSAPSPATIGRAANSLSQVKERPRREPKNNKEKSTKQ